VSLGNLPKAVSISHAAERHYRRNLERRGMRRPNDLSYFLPKSRIRPHIKDEQGTIDDLPIGRRQRSLQVWPYVFSMVLGDRPFSTDTNSIVTVAQRIN